MVAKTIEVKLIRSTNKCTEKQKATVLGLGLTKLGRTRTLENTPAVRGMIKKMIQWLEVKE
ncbi:MAG: 50S ribosomal protein L30 [Bdellovibrio sp. CG12_big_fil_rev_8_21_14_0_65_39_13]|nr:MAG: 50S ribosomal protein L30 [Bdellovibrio sp. CG22_combo_CG10-13_8_21_14_all_39_27]PIQ62638.1 MAG: 50S ribosomal protein L30 [Bdellovibrio sp. CG12_big_fil_rev_8_21_14_0_65_39_13]PIR36993.1 MAG: 50S ribosomal protein L30 [Bdellovibrio sp. CG11_big_fil_rev_8_21_14_0_20_39_38]PJB54616.1 MAG: 50S ribosomal protein L30 [Bdellovibrio sp. CG_4_9_14_3_um_filter_39_7]